MRLCVVGDESDFSARYVAWLAEQRGIEVLLLREDTFGTDWSFAMRDEGAEGTVVSGDLSMSLSDIDAAFVRLNPEPAVPAELGIEDQAKPVYLQERRQGLHWFLDHAPFSVVNRPSAGRSNLSKPYQMRLLEELGLQVPEWAVTNDPTALRSFIEAAPDGAVYKACSGVRSHVRRADEGLLERLAEGSTPVVVQQYVKGADVRVHTVGSRTFATEIRSTAVDYRFDDETPAYAEIRAPRELLDRCVAAAASENLPLAGFDFRRDPAGGWWCLEMNPVPTFLPYEAMTGHPIGDAIVDLLLPAAELNRERSPLLSQSVPPPQPIQSRTTQRRAGLG